MYFNVYLLKQKNLFQNIQTFKLCEQTNTVTWINEVNHMICLSMSSEKKNNNSVSIL